MYRPPLTSLPVRGVLVLCVWWLTREYVSPTLALIGLGIFVAATLPRTLRDMQRRPLVGGVRPGFGSQSPRPELLDGFETRDDPGLLGPSNDVHDLHPPPPERVGLTGISTKNADFSLVSALDFASDLFASCQLARATGELSQVSPHLSEGALEALDAGRAGLERVELLALDQATVSEAGIDEVWARLGVEINALVGETRDGDARVFELRVRLRLACHAASVHEGAWTLLSLVELSRAPLSRPPSRAGLSSEPGSSLPTVLAPDLEARKARFDERNPRHDWDALSGWIARVFAAIATAPVRGTAALGEAVRPDCANHLSFERARLSRTGLVEHVEDAQFDRAELVRIDGDPRYDHATFRVRGRQRRWVETEDGAVWRGARESVREFSEYWTLIRHRDPARHGPDETGRQGWALWRVIPDESYTG